MRHKIFRYTVLTMVGMLMLATMTGCLFGGDDEPVVEEETPDIDATVSARLTAAAPTEVPPDPEGTVAAMLAAALADQEAQAALDAQATAEAQPPAYEYSGTYRHPGSDDSAHRHAGSDDSAHRYADPDPYR